MVPMAITKSCSTCDRIYSCFKFCLPEVAPFCLPQVGYASLSKGGCRLGISGQVQEAPHRVPVHSGHSLYN